MTSSLHRTSAEPLGSCHCIAQKAPIWPRSPTKSHGPNLAQPIHQEQADRSAINQ